MIVSNIVLVGTSHIAKQSLKEVDDAVASHSPKVIAIELDRGRLEGLLNPQPRKLRLSDIRHVGFTGFLFSMLGAWAERMLGKQVGMDPGAEMLHAIKLARERKIPVALIDQDIRITLKRLSKGVTWREKGRFVWDVIRGMMGGKKKLPFDLKTVPSQDVIDTLIKDVRKRYPNVYRVLVHERNEVMAKRLAALGQQHKDGKVVAIIGAGHRQDIAVLVRRYISQSI
jgi:pheromone shutdown-related protein TraB